MSLLNEKKDGVTIIRPYMNQLRPKFEATHMFANAKTAVSILTKVATDDILHIEVESNKELLNCEMHPLLQAANTAFYDHLPLVLTPDVIWYCISNAVAVHVNKHSQEMRDLFVGRKSKEPVEVERLGFLLGDSNPWHEVVEEFCEKIKEKTNVDIVSKLQADFSTTSKISRVVSHVVIMDSMQKYFDYSLKGGCGIPEVRLHGSKRDWESVKAKASDLVNLIPKFKEWIPGVVKVLDELINAFDDKIDVNFWKSIYHNGGGSGAGGITGWLLCFFPFLRDSTHSEYCWDGKTWKDAVKSKGVSENQFDYHLNQVPFVFKFGDTGLCVDLLFVAGLVGVTVDKDHALTPIFGYAVTENRKVKSLFEATL